MEEKSYTLKEAAARLQVPTRQIRYFCDRGLVPGVRRLPNGLRAISENQLNWLNVLLGLKRCGMRSAEIKHFTTLYRQGESTLAERRAILDTKRRQLWQKIEELQSSIDFIERQEELTKSE